MRPGLFFNQGVLTPNVQFELSSRYAFNTVARRQSPRASTLLIIKFEVLVNFNEPETTKNYEANLGRYHKFLHTIYTTNSIMFTKIGHPQYLGNALYWYLLTWYVTFEQSLQIFVMLESVLFAPLQGFLCLG